MNNTSLVDQSSVYTDMSGLNKLKEAAIKDDPEALKAVGKQFESYFIHLMLKSMRDANKVFQEDSIFNSNEMEFYQQMMDSQVSLQLSKQGSLGLADMITKQIQSQYKLHESEEGAAVKNTENDESVSTKKSPVTSLDTFEGSITKAQPSVQVLETEQRSSLLMTSDPDSFSSKQEFIDFMSPIAEKVAGEVGVDPKLLVAQAALETGWGKFIMKNGGGSSYNLFGIKADRRWSGDTVQVQTLEYQNGIAARERASFRSYNSFEESFKDYVDFVTKQGRYEEAVNNISNAQQYIQSLHRAGYATDPQYSDKVMRIYQDDSLQTKFDSIDRS